MYVNGATITIVVRPDMYKGKGYDIMMSLIIWKLETTKLNYDLFTIPIRLTTTNGCSCIKKTLWIGLHNALINM